MRQRDVNSSVLQTPLEDHPQTLSAGSPNWPKGIPNTLHTSPTQSSALQPASCALEVASISIGRKLVSTCRKLAQLCKTVRKQTSTFPDSSVSKESTCHAGDPSSIPGSGRSPGEEKGCPLQYSGLENSMDYTGHKESRVTELFPLS
ncbi:unnamed protein product [Rangifer tarandus platyrhynchus]|uniref:Uncharacterized protein n=1 Tax=Rangifer tarandus platyrhynchus TaxID=3082113 RepID=A0ABN8YL41_RANTA|nr:unnamed protein product [Rangifer tarandus platyrhynchus]